jgi:hypothetical protein
MTRLRLAASLVVAVGFAAVACNPVYYVGWSPDGGDGGLDAGDGGSDGDDAGVDGGDGGFDGGDAGLDGGDGGFDGGDAGLDAGNDGGGASCSDFSACSCGDYCASADLDGGSCMSPDDPCTTAADCDPGALCLYSVNPDAGCSRGHCYVQAPDGGPCASDSDCPCTSTCAKLDGGTPGCVPLSNQLCTDGGGCGDGGFCLNLYRGGAICAGICKDD